jgi:hypothetical protein
MEETGKIKVTAVGSSACDSSHCLVRFVLTNYLPALLLRSWQWASKEGASKEESHAIAKGKAKGKEGDKNSCVCGGMSIVDLAYHQYTLFDCYRAEKQEQR